MTNSFLVKYHVIPRSVCTSSPASLPAFHSSLRPKEICLSCPHPPLTIQSNECSEELLGGPLKQMKSSRSLPLSSAWGRWKVMQVYSAFSTSLLEDGRTGFGVLLMVTWCTLCTHTHTHTHTCIHTHKHMHTHTTLLLRSSICAAMTIKALAHLQSHAKRITNCRMSPFLLLSSCWSLRDTDLYPEHLSFLETYTGD